jgi:alkylhydroperoxidase family enzyme
MNKPRIAPLEPPYTPEVEAALTKWMPKGSRGAVAPLSLFRTIARHERLSDRARALGAVFLGHGTLPVRVRELVILRTCARCGADYEWGVHATAFAAAAGIDGATLAATRSEDTPAGEDGPIVRAADELHDHGTIEDGTWAELAARFDDEQLLELLALAGFYHLVSFLANGARVELEPWAMSARTAGSVT